MTAQFLDLNELPNFPRALEIQTTNACNARCSVCPHNEVVGELGVGRMATDLLFKILDECADRREHIEWLMPYYNNEPFTDKRMLEVLRFIRTNIGCKIEISTNGALLSPDLGAVLIEEALLDVIRFSVFGAEKRGYEAEMGSLNWEATTSNIKKFLGLLRAKQSPIAAEVVLVGTDSLTPHTVRLARELWEPRGAKVRIFGYLDRAANSTERLNLLPRNQSSARIIGCDLNRPFERTCILNTGQVTLCSQDWRGRTNFGSVADKSILEIWRGMAYAHARSSVCGEKLAAKDFICRDCKLAILE